MQKPRLSFPQASNVSLSLASKGLQDFHCSFSFAGDARLCFLSFKNLMARSYRLP